MLIAMAGFKTAGKDAAASVLIKEYGCTKIALADPVRDLAYAINPYVKQDVRLDVLVDIYGWDYCKNTYPEVRRLMQAVGTEGGRNLFGENFWIERLQDRYPDLSDAGSRYVLTDARFLNEGRFVQDNNGVLVWIDRPGLKSDGHASESGELREIADHIITNDESLKDLQEDVRFMCFMNDISKENAV